AVARQGDPVEETVIAPGAHARLDLVVADGGQDGGRGRRGLRHHGQPPVPGGVVDRADRQHPARGVGVAEVAEAERERRGGGGEDAGHPFGAVGGALVAVGREGEGLGGGGGRPHGPGGRRRAVVADA